MLNENARKLPLIAKKFVKDFDSYKSVKPFKFKIRLRKKGK